MLQLGIYWLIYFFIHSALASLWVKGKVGLKLPWVLPYYRILYNLIAIIGLIPLLYMSLTRAGESEILALRLLGGLLCLAGIYFMRKAFLVFNTLEFLGLKPEGNSPLVKTGMYAYVRHPLYFASILLIGGLSLLFPSPTMWLTLVISYTYLLIGSKLEERKLKKHYGQVYVDYSKEVKALIPYVY